MNSQLYNSWKRYVPDLGTVISRMQDKTTIAIGVAAFPRIIPALFLDRAYQIYCVKKAVDIDVLRKYANIFCLEEVNPKVAERVHSTGYLMRNYVFQGFLKSRRYPFRLMFYQTTPPIVQAMEERGIEWIGNRPESFADVIVKGSFRDVVKQRGLPHIPDWRLGRDEFLAKYFQELYTHWNRSFVVQRADFDVSGEQGTFFVHENKDWEIMHEILSKDTRYKEVTISPFIIGDSVSMLGCITQKGVLTSTLQLQFIDVPEALHGQLPTGVFLGHDWGFRSWTDETEKTAQRIVESIGEHLAGKGYKGIFGIDLIYDVNTREIFPLECNPRFTGALPVYSLQTMANGVPPIELFHLMSHLNIESNFDFEMVNQGLKKRIPASHISLTPKGVYKMTLPLNAGVYSYDGATKSIAYERPGAFLWDIKEPHEFLLIDSVPYPGERVIQNVPRLFKLIFKDSIAESSFAVRSEIGELITQLSTALRRGQEAPPFVEQKSEEALYSMEI